MKFSKILFQPAFFLLSVLLLVGFSIFCLDEPIAWFIYAYLGFLHPFFAVFTSTMDYIMQGKIIYQNYQNLQFAHYFHFISWRYCLFSLLFLSLYFIQKEKKYLKYLLWLILVHFFTSLVVGFLKFTFHRARPTSLYQSSTYDLDFWRGEGDSFPSGHTGDYWGLFLPLILIFPKYKTPLLITPILISLGRLVLHAHYLSDVLFSMGLTWFFTLIFAKILNTEKLVFTHKSL